MKDIGRQYSKDDKYDPSGFLKRARLHQSRFRAEKLNLQSVNYGNYLTKEDAEAGMNFYNGFGIFDTVRNRFPKYNMPLYANMLRSEHIPFNLFVPFNFDKNYCKKVFNEFLKNRINSIDRIEIEHAPKPRKNYLNDATSFDTYIEYTTNDSLKGIIGIEVKYTEREYGLEKDSTQETAIKEKTSKYYTTSQQCKLYRPEAIDKLTSDKYRQVWRNQLLGESILITDKNKFTYFTSLTIFPQGNSHFVETSKDYIEMLTSNDLKFIPITYEEFFSVCKKYCPYENYQDWINYLISRYIVTVEDR
jgi:hypothetical protein